MTERELQQYFDEANVSISSNGIIYRTDKTRVDNVLLEKWFNERVEMRKLT